MEKGKEEEEKEEGEEREEKGEEEGVVYVKVLTTFSIVEVQFFSLE